MNQILEFITSLATWPTIIPLSLFFVACFFLFLSLFLSVEHFFEGFFDAHILDIHTDSPHVEHDHDFNFVGSLLGVESRVPFILYAIITSFLMIVILHNVEKFYAFDTGILSILLGFVALVLSLAISSRISYFILRPVGKFMEDNSGEIIDIKGIIGKIDYINKEENFVRIEAVYLGHKDILTVYISPKEIEIAQLEDEVVIVSKEEDRSGNIIFNGGLLKKY